MQKPQQVLFICTGNYYRSRFAEAVFNYYAELAGLPWQAISRGLSPHLFRCELSPQVEGALVSRGIPLRYAAPYKRELTEADLEQADRAIALQEHEHRPLMRLRFPAWVDRIEYWSASTPLAMGLGATLGVIEASVQELVLELARESAPLRTSR